MLKHLNLYDVIEWANCVSPCLIIGIIKGASLDRQRYFMTYIGIFNANQWAGMKQDPHMTLIDESYLFNWLDRHKTVNAITNIYGDQLSAANLIKSGRKCCYERIPTV